MRTRLRLSRRNPLIALTSLGLVALAGASLLEDGGFEGAFNFVEADPGSPTAFETGEEQAQYLVVGFDAEPVLLEVSNPFQPQVVSGFSYLTPDGQPAAAYFIYDEAGRFVAAQEAAIPAVSSIQPTR